MFASCFIIYGPLPCGSLMASLYFDAGICNAAGQWAAFIFLLQKKFYALHFIEEIHRLWSLTDTSGNVKSVITGDTDLIYRLSSEDQKEREEATNEAIALTLTLK